MNKISIGKAQLLQFFDLIGLKGSVSTKEVLLNITPTEINVSLSTCGKMVAVIGKMSGKYDITQQIGITDITLFKKFLNSFSSDIIDVDIEDNKVILSSEKDNVKISTTLSDPQYITNVVDESKVKSWIDKSSGNEVTLPVGMVKQIVSYLNTMEINSLVLEGSDETITLKIENQQNEIVASFPVKEQFKPFKVKLKEIFLELLSSFNGEVIISVNKKAPVYLSVKNDNCEFVYFIAPMLDD